MEECQSMLVPTTIPSSSWWNRICHLPLKLSTDGSAIGSKRSSIVTVKYAAKKLKLDSPSTKSSTPTIWTFNYWYFAINLFWYFRHRARTLSVSIAFLKSLMRLLLKQSTLVLLTPSFSEKFFTKLFCRTVASFGHIIVKFPDKFFIEFIRTP